MRAIRRCFFRCCRVVNTAMVCRQSPRLALCHSWFFHCHKIGEGVSFGSEAAGTGFRVLSQRKGMQKDLLKNISNPTHTCEKMPMLAEQEKNQRELKNARALFSQYDQMSLTATLQREQGSILKESLGEDVLAVASAACYSSSRACMAKLESKWIQRHNQILIKQLQSKYLHALDVFSCHTEGCCIFTMHFHRDYQ